MLQMFTRPFSLNFYGRMFYADLVCSMEKLADFVDQSLAYCSYAMENDKICLTNGLMGLETTI